MSATPATGAHTISIWRSGVRTSSGVAIGDPLARARERYPGLRCGVRNRNSEYVPYRYCTGRIEERYLWFGLDPIKSITVSSVPLG